MDNNNKKHIYIYTHIYDIYIYTYTHIQNILGTMWDRAERKNTLRMLIDKQKNRMRENLH